jgi:NitT/TauT family transport system permease protein
MSRVDPFMPTLVGAGSLALLVGLWEYVGSQDGSALATVLPPPSRFISAVAGSGFRIGLGSQAVPLSQSILSTFFRVFAGMSIAFIAAVLTGALLSLSRVAIWCLSPVLYVLAPIAPIAWIPTAIVVFGISNITAVFIVFMGVYFILTIATLAEIRRIPVEFLTRCADSSGSCFRPSCPACSLCFGPISSQRGWPFSSPRWSAFATDSAPSS